VVRNAKTDKQLKKNTLGLAVGLREDKIFKKKMFCITKCLHPVHRTKSPLDSTTTGVNNTM
jgi:hypothetical protein